MAMRQEIPWKPSEETVRLVLLRNKGDLIRSSGELNVRPSTLVNWIRSVPSVSNLWNEMEGVKTDPKFEAASQAQFEAEIKARLQGYRLDGIEVLHELATTDHDGVSSMAEVRLKAAVELSNIAAPTSSPVGGLLQELNLLYKEHAPRIKSLRAIEQNTAIEIQFDEPAEVSLIHHG
jgi:hypothetical protein